jgi:hypothetical protein
LLLEHAVAVAKLAGRRVQRHHAPGFQIHRVERIKTVLQLHAISADVLHRRGTHRTRNQGQVFQARVALAERPQHKAVPALARAGRDDPGVGLFAHQALAHHLHLQHHGLHVFGQHDVAAAAQNELGRRAVLGVADHRANIGLTGDGDQRGRVGRQAEGVERLEAGVVEHAKLRRFASRGGHGHGRIFRDFSRLPRALSLPHSP